MNINSKHLRVSELIDPITVEVVRMRLENIVKEMGISMMRSSGSPVITEAGDFNTALFDVRGRTLAYSDYVQFHIGSGSVAITSLIDVVGLDGLAPGDAYISNDPHTAGSTHPPDISVITPIFDGAHLVGFAQSQAHFMDVGGSTAGGFAPTAKDCFSEAIRLPPGVKIMEKGEIVESTRRILVNNVRLPVVLWNDIRSLIASNNVGVRRVLETLREVGAESFEAVIAHNFEVTNRVMQGRVALLPDGVYEATEWQEHNGHVDDLFRIQCKLIVCDRGLTFDFTGSAPQTDGFVNCSYGATLGSIASALIPILAWDVPVNSGVLESVAIIAPKGSIINPVAPAPVSNGHLEVGARVSRLVTKLLNQACERSSEPEIRDRAQGIWADSWTGGITAGDNDRDQFYVFFNMDGGGMGSGAQVVCDGLDCSGMMTQVSNILPDVEMNELFYPVLYLWKKVDPMTGGAGANRGGMGLDFAWMLHGTDTATETVFAPSSRVPAAGYGGGYPGGGSMQRIHRDVDLVATLRCSAIQIADGREPQEDLLELTAVGLNIAAGDVFHQNIAGGGGYGDPLLRAPQVVAKDLLDGYITPMAAEMQYGVVVNDEGQPDIVATGQRRAALRKQRIGREPERKCAATLGDATAGAGTLALLVGLDSTGAFCRACGERLGPDSNWRRSAITTDLPLSERLGDLGTRVRACNQLKDVRLHETYCPGCATSLDVDIEIVQSSHGASL